MNKLTPPSARFLGGNSSYSHRNIESTTTENNYIFSENIFIFIDIILIQQKMLWVDHEEEEEVFFGSNFDSSVFNYIQA